MKITSLLVLIILISIFKKQNGDFDSSKCDFDYAQSPRIIRCLSVVEDTMIQDTTYEYSIKVIKKWETYSATRYELWGDEYIGYGHLLYKADTITYLSKLEADSLVRSDFNEAILFVNKYLDTLHISRKYVIAMLVFNTKRNKLPGSTLFKLIRQKKPYQVIQEQYYRYTYAGKRHLPKMIYRRIDEFKIW